MAEKSSKIWKCYSCDILLTPANQSREHIILNACGGRLSSKNLLCKKCNNQFGNSFDNELAKQVNGIANYLMIKRERDKPQPIVGKIQSSDTEYKYLADGSLVKSKPDIKIEKNGDRINIHVSASSEEQFNEVIKGLIRKYPQLKMEDIQEAARHSQYFLQEPISSQLQFGGTEVFKSITKTAVNYYIHRGGNSFYIKHLLPYLKGESDLDVAWHHHSAEPLYVPQEDEVTHLITIKGDPTESILYAYIELFNFHNYIVLLNDNYDGERFVHTYLFDVLQMAELTHTVPLPYRRNDLLQFFTHKQTLHQEIVKKINRTWRIADQIQIDFHLAQQIKSTVLKAFKQFPKGTVFSEDKFNELMTIVFAELQPFIDHQSSRHSTKT